VPFPIGQAADPHAYAAEMADGFSQSYDFLAGRGPALLDQLKSAAHEHVRYVFRNTFEYYAALIAAARSDASGRVSLPALPPARAAFQALEEDEIRALAQFDIPRFTLPASSESLAHAHNCFRQSGFDLARAGVEQLGEEDKKRHLAAIRLSWSLYHAAKCLG
jgi:lantibiotic modifying enzyme